MLAAGLAAALAAGPARAQVRPVPVEAPLAAAPSVLLPALPALSAPLPVLQAARLPAPAPLAELPRLQGLPANEPAAALGRPLRLVIAGPPGSGKGTHSKRLARDFGVVHVSAGDLLRERAKTDPALDEIMRRGQLVPADVVVRLVEERLAQPDARERGFVLDGFPRRLVEAEALERMGLALDALILLDVQEEELLRRIRGRGRSDDSEAVFRGRMKVFREETGPAIERLKARLPVVAPDLSAPDIDTNYGRVRAALETLFSGR